MGNNVNSWQDTLISFLENSNEDERLISHFCLDIVPFLIHHLNKQKLNWIEIGVGNGVKSLGFLKAISQAKYFEEVELTVCEPHSNWISTLEQNGIAEKIRTLSKLNFEEVTVESYFRNKPSCDFLSVVQLMYESPIKDAILFYIDFNRHNLKRTVFWVDTEDESSDFAIMRQQLNNIGIKTPRSHAREFRDELATRKIEYICFKVENKTCEINIEHILKDKNHWIFQFISGLSTKKYRQMPTRQQNMLIESIRNYVKTLEKPQLYIPDISILGLC